MSGRRRVPCAPAALVDAGANALSIVVAPHPGKRYQGEMHDLGHFMTHGGDDQYADLDNRLVGDPITRRTLV